MKTNNTYGYDTKNIKRFLPNANVNNNSYLNDVISFYDDSFDYDQTDLFNDNKKLKPQVPEIILLKEEDNVFYEVFTNKVIVDLNSDSYANGLVIDKEEFVDNLVLNDGSLLFAFSYFRNNEDTKKFTNMLESFISKAQINYINVCDKLDQKELKLKLKECKELYMSK